MNYTQDVANLQRLIDNAEHNDAEAHKLYNNLGLAYFAARDFRQSLKAHRQEKEICKRLLNDNPTDTQRHLDLAIAYRRCGDAMIKLNKVIDARTNKVTKDRVKIIKLAQEQHERGIRIAKESPCTMQSKSLVKLEVQAASAALGQSTLSLALQTKKRKDFIKSLNASHKAAKVVQNLNLIGKAGITYDKKQSILLGISLNFAIALSELNEKSKAKSLLQSVAIKARVLNDKENLIRAISNLSEEASNDNDWHLSCCYAKEWCKLARLENDTADECDALRKYAIALREVGDLKLAEESLQRALTLISTDDQRAEAKTFLKVIQQDIEDHDHAQFQYSSVIKKAQIAKNEGDYGEEAKNRLKAGNYAFTLRMTEKVLENLTRYFQLVDDYGCEPVMTGVDECIHNAAIANMGESMWTVKRYEEAVKWATRELSIYDGDLPGQAQAWCNLGVYLDDYGKKERAVEALTKSIEIAKKCGETDTLKRAEENLQLIVDALKKENREGKNFSNDSFPNEANIDGVVEEVDVKKKRAAISLEDSDYDEEECAVIDVDMLHSRGSTTKNGIHGQSISTTTNRNSNVTPTHFSKENFNNSSQKKNKRISTGSQKRKHTENCNDRGSHGDSGSQCITADSDSVNGDNVSHGEKSVIMTSNQATKKTKIGKEDTGDAESSFGMRPSHASATKQSMVRGRRSNGDKDNSNRYSEEYSTSGRSRDVTTYIAHGQSNETKVLKNIIELPREYRAVCLKMAESQPSSRKNSNTFRPRPMVINAFREVASALVSREACDQIHAPIARLNLSGLLADNDDVSTVFETLSTVHGDYDIYVDLSFNPIISSSAYDRLSSSRKIPSLSSSPFLLHAVKQLDLSCAGISAETVRKLSEAMSNEQNGSLAHVTDLNLSKNSLGRFKSDTASAVARLMHQASRLRSLDLSMNMLSNEFMTDLISNLNAHSPSDNNDTNNSNSNNMVDSSLQTLNLCLNNRKAPTGLLQTTVTHLITDAFSTLFQKVETLEAVNVRACGANFLMRSALRQLNDSMADSLRTIITVSDENLEEDM